MLEEMPIEYNPEQIAFREIPNARVQREVQTWHLLHAKHCPETVEDMQWIIQERIALQVVDPEELWGLGTRLGYTVDLCWSENSDDGSYDALLRHATQAPEHGAQPRLLSKVTSLRPWHSYANNPQRERLNQELIPQLRAHLKQSLPDYLHPSLFVFIESWPLTISGKLDRQALPAPLAFRPEVEGTMLAPHTTIEKKLAAIWTGVLGLEQVSLSHNFFDLGGDSIRGMQIISRARSQGLRIAPRDLFQYQTLAELATVVQADQEESETSSEEPQAQTTTPPHWSCDRQKLALLLQVPENQIEDAYPLAPMQENMLAQRLLAGDTVRESLVPDGGSLPVPREAPRPDVGNLAMSPDRATWWLDRLSRVLRLVDDL